MEMNENEINITSRSNEINSAEKLLPISYSGEPLTISFKGNYVYDAIRVLIENKSQEADICLRFLLRYIVYALYTAEHVGYDLRVADDVMATGFTWCPPFAMMEAFSRVCDLGQLMKERLKPEIVNAVDIDHIIGEQIKSKYDYRIYFKAK